jgi:hypothetical protein
MNWDFSRLGWFFLGHMAFLGTVSGGVLGAVYGFVLGFGLPPAALIGALSGALVGLLLGVIDGLVLYAMARVLGRPPRGEAPFRELGGVACALTSAVLASAAFWAMSRGSISLTNRSRDLVILVVAPTIVATIAMWLSGRRVAGRYEGAIPSCSCELPRSLFSMYLGA